MMNIIPGTAKQKLVSPFMLVHGRPPDTCSWVNLFSICYFHHTKDGHIKRSKNQSNSMDGVIVGRSSTSNALLVWNPRNKQFYQPDSYRIDPYHIPGTVYPTLKYDGGLFCHLYRDGAPSQDKPYPPGTRIERFHPQFKVMRSGTVMDIPPDPTEPDNSKTYLIQFDDSSTIRVPLSMMPSLLPKPPVDIDVLCSSNLLLPPFLQLNNKITYEHRGQYWKGYLSKKDGTYRFSYKRHPNSKNEEWGVDLHNLPTIWIDMT
jgi:hypothetical protein